MSRILLFSTLQLNVYSYGNWLQLDVYRPRLIAYNLVAFHSISNTDFPVYVVRTREHARVEEHADTWSRTQARHHMLIHHRPLIVNNFNQCWFDNNNRLGSKMYYSARFTVFSVYMITHTNVWSYVYVFVYTYECV